MPTSLIPAFSRSFLALLSNSRRPFTPWSMLEGPLRLIQGSLTVFCLADPAYLRCPTRQSTISQQRSETGQFSHAVGREPSLGRGGTRVLRQRGTLRSQQERGMPDNKGSNQGMGVNQDTIVNTQQQQCNSFRESSKKTSQVSSTVTFSPDDQQGTRTSITEVSSTPQSFFDFDYSHLEDDAFVLSPVPRHRKGSCDYPAPKQPTLARDSVLRLSLEQAGSRRLQTILDSLTEPDTSLISEQLIQHAETAIFDQFGNYVFQKIILIGKPKHLRFTLQLIKTCPPRFFRHIYACRVVQVLIQQLGPASLQLLELIEHDLIALAKDNQANHVIQKLFEVIGPAMPIRVIQMLHENFEEMASNVCGCRVIQKSLQYCSEQSTRIFISTIASSIAKLSKCQFGNYIVSIAYASGDTKCKEAMNEEVLRHSLELCCDKFASNVVEKSLSCCPSMPNRLVFALNSASRKEGGLIFAAKNKFGNYVIKSLLSRVEGEAARLLFSTIRKHEKSLQGHRCGLYVVQELSKYAN